jgi:uncharacterized integral membrane protein
MSRLTGSRLLGSLAVIVVVLLAMAFAAANSGHRVTLELGLFTLYRAPVTLVAFSGLFMGMLIMFVAGIHSDLKVRRILRERLAEETREAKEWIDRNQQDLFAQNPDPDPAAGSAREAVPDRAAYGAPVRGPETPRQVKPGVASDAESGPSREEVPNPVLTPLPLPPMRGEGPEDEEEGPETE